jgi:hypothetical protein
MDKNETKQKTIYDLNLHESIMVKVTGQGYPTTWQVTRVPGGWFYQEENPRKTTMSEFFVLYNNEFQEVKENKEIWEK